MSRQAIRPARLRKIKGQVVLDGAVVKEIPVVCWQDSGIDDNVLSYCIQRIIFDKRKLSSVEEETYILLEWLNWLATRGKYVEEAARSDYLSWNSLARSLDKVSVARLHRKHEVVWNFYHHLRGKRKKFKYHTAGFFESISERIVSGNGAESWSMKLRREISSRIRKPRVPTEQDVTLIFNKLGAHPVPFLSERNFLIAQVEARSGLRAMGAEGLTVSALARALEIEGVLQADDSLAALATNPDEQTRIRRALRKAQEAGRSAFEIHVVEKGGKERKVEVPLDLMRRLLDHVWGRRAWVIKNRRGAIRENRDALFVSWKTGHPMSRGAIKDLVKDAFREAGVKGSGHALRAFYLTNKAVELIRDARRRFGDNYSMDDIYNELAAYAGHRHRATLFAYIDVARLWAAALDRLD